MIKAFVHRIGFYLAASGIFMLTMLVGFSVFYHYVEGLNWLDSFYFTVITTRTVGFGDISPQTTVGKIGTILNALLPATVFLGASLVVLQTIMKELEAWWRRYQMRSNVDHDIIICNEDMLSSMLKEYQATKKGFVVVAAKPYESLEQWQQEIIGPGNYLQGDATKEHVLEQAGLARAHALIIGTNDDSTNMYVLVTAHAMNKQIKKLVRINKAENSSKFLSVGADMVLPATSIMGQMLSQAAFNPHSHNFLVALHTHTEDPFFEDSVVDEQAAGKPIFEAFERPIAIVRNGEFIYDIAGQSLQLGDVVVRIGLKR